MSRSPANAFKRRRLSQAAQQQQVIQESEEESEPESSDFSAQEDDPQQQQQQQHTSRAPCTAARREVVADTEGESELDDEPVAPPRPRSHARDGHERIQDSEEPQGDLLGNHDGEPDQDQQDNTDEAAQDAWSSFAEEYYDMVEQLPLEVQRAFRLILEMEHETRKSMDSSKLALQEYLSACRPFSLSSLLSLESMASTIHSTPQAWPLAHIPKLSQVSLHLSQSSRNAGDKFSLASTLCESVDRHIQRLDADLTRLLEPVEPAQDASSEEDASGEEVDSDEFEVEDQTTVRSALDERLAEDSSGEQQDDDDDHHHNDDDDDDSHREEEEVTAEIVPPPIPPEKKKGTIIKLHSNAQAQQQRKQKTKSPPVQPITKQSKESSEQSKLKRKKVSASGRKKKKVPKLSKELLATLEDMPASADEPRYCYCNNVAMGDMVACDNEDCPREWFHLDCVGLDEAPEGDWYCNACSAARRVGLVQSKPSAQQKR